jgi:uncharacterized membrane protein YfcA
MQALVLLSLGGILAGLLAGLLGVGGGIVLVPLLSLVLPFCGLPVEQTMQCAVATSMTVISVTAMASAHVHWKQGLVVWPVCRFLSIGAVPGTLLGVYLAHFLAGWLLQIIFGIFILIIAIRILFDVQAKADRDLASPRALVAMGVVVGMISALVGMGGGGLIVPYLQRFNINMRSIISTSALCTLPIAITASLLFIYLGLSQARLSPLPWSTGYIYWPAFLATALAAVIFAPIGAKVAHRIPSALLKKIFAIFLIVISIHMLTMGIRQ